MKPAPFEYHVPDTAAEAAALLAELGDEAKVLAGGQSLIPMLALRLAGFDHLVDIGRIAELKGIERRDGSPADRGRHHPGRGRGQRRGGGGRPPADAGHAAHRPLPDPQPGHARRFGRPRRPGRRVPGRRAGARRHHGGGLAPGRRTIAGRATSSTACGRTTIAPDELLVGVSFPVWTGRRGFAVRGVRPPPRRLRHRRRRRGRRARRRRPHPTQRHRPDRPRLDPRAGRPARGRAAGRPSPTSIPARSAAWPWPGSNPVLDDQHGSVAYRKRVGAGRWWPGPWTPAAGRGGAAMGEVDG